MEYSQTNKVTLVYANNIRKLKHYYCELIEDHTAQQLRDPQSQNTRVESSLFSLRKAETWTKPLTFLRLGSITHTGQ